MRGGSDDKHKSEIPLGGAFEPKTGAQSIRRALRRMHDQRRCKTKAQLPNIEFVSISHQCSRTAYVPPIPHLALEVKWSACQRFNPLG